MASNLKRTRFSPSQMGARARFVCFDCGETTGSPMQTYRLIGPADAPYTGVVVVHRGGQGCHKSLTSSEVRALGA